MKRGDFACRFELHFSHGSLKIAETPEQRERQMEQQNFAEFILTLLPGEEGVTLADLQATLIARGIHQEFTRPARLLEALRHLHHAGFVASTASRPGDDFTHRRYWRVPTSS